MKHKLAMRKSTLQLIDLDRSGCVDARSEIGNIVDLDEWMTKPTTKLHCKCDHVRDNEQLIPSHILITETHMYLMRETDSDNKLVINIRRKLSTIMKITTKAKLCEVVKLQYGSKGLDGAVHITDADRLHIPKYSGTVIKTIKSILQPRSRAATPSPSSSRRSSLTSNNSLGVNYNPMRRSSAIADEILAKSPLAVSPLAVNPLAAGSSSGSRRGSFHVSPKRKASK